MQNNKFKHITKEQTTIIRIGRTIYIYEFYVKQEVMNSKFKMKIFYAER